VKIIKYRVDKLLNIWYNKGVMEGGHLKSGIIQSCGCLQSEHIIKIGKANKKYNIYDLENQEYGIGFTGKGEEFWFDKEDYETIKDYCWNISDKGYVETKIYDDNQIQHTLRMHRLIMNAQQNEEIDHIKHKLYDNRKSKLRKVTSSQNKMNAINRKNNTSGHTGVSWSKSNQKWIAYINKNKKWINLGYYNNFEQACRIRKEAEEKYFGEFSYDNSIYM
jgi:hypothetical protein